MSHGSGKTALVMGIDLRQSEAYRNAVDTLARYVLGHGGTSKGSKKLAELVIAAHGRFAPENIATVFACELEVTNLQPAVEHARTEVKLEER